MGTRLRGYDVAGVFTGACDFDLFTRSRAGTATGSLGSNTARFWEEKPFPAPVYTKMPQPVPHFPQPQYRRCHSLVFV